MSGHDFSLDTNCLLMYAWGKGIWERLLQDKDQKAILPITLQICLFKKADENFVYSLKIFYIIKYYSIY